MLILPLKFIREEDKKTVGSNLYHLAKLGHLGLPVVESVIVVPPVKDFEKVINKYLKHNINIKDNLNNIKSELLGLQFPESLKSIEQIAANSGDSKFIVNISKLWENLLSKWVYEITSKIERNIKNILELTPQLVVFSANFTAFGKGYFDEDREHAVIKVDHGQINFQTSSAIENLIIVGNKKLLLSQVYYWGIEDNKIKIVKVAPFTQSSIEEKNDKTETIAPVKHVEEHSIKTATKIFVDFKDEQLLNFSADGIVYKVSKNDIDNISEKLNSALKVNPQLKIILDPNFSLSSDKILEFAKTFLFFRNKKKLDIQIIFPETYSVNDFLNLKREYASLGIYSKGSLKIWKQFNTVADFLNIDDYLDAGFDGAIINLDKVCQIVCGVDAQIFLESPQIDWIIAMEKYFKEMQFVKLIKNHKQILITGSISRNEELLNFFVRSGIWGISFENSVAQGMKEHIAFLEKQNLKKLNSIKVQH